MDVSLLQEKSTFAVLTMRMSPHLEPFFFLIYDCILHKCCAISNQYHFTNPISTFLPKFRGGGGGLGPDPRFPPSGSAHVYRYMNTYKLFETSDPDLSCLSLNTLCTQHLSATVTWRNGWCLRTRLPHSDHLGQFYESSLECMPTDYFRKRQQQPP